jgi:hypothetical protein
MMDEFYQIILKLAKESEYNVYTRFFPEMPICPTSYHCLAKKYVWQHRYEIIFSHSFAKAFFGEDWVIELQKLVLRRDPVKYIIDIFNIKN